MISGTKLKLEDCPHCNEPGLYLKRRKFEAAVWRCCYCHSTFTPEEKSEIDGQRVTDQKVTQVYRGCTAAAFIAIVGAGILVMWLIMDVASKG